MVAVNPPGFIQALNTHTAEIDRGAHSGLIAGSRIASSLVARGGVNPDLGGGLAVTQNGAPNMSVNVASGICYVAGSEGSKQGTYVATNDATLNVVIAAADVSNPRIDLIVFKVQDAAYSGAVNSSSIVAVTGTPAGSPSAPAAPSNSVILAQIAVAASDTSIVTGDITDRRTYLAAVGGTIRCTSTTRPGVGTVTEGQEIYELDTNTCYYTTDTGTTWVRISDDLNQAKGVVAGKRWPSTGASAIGAGIAAETATNLETGSFTYEANRRYRINAYFQYLGTVTGEVFQLKIRETNVAGLQLANVVIHITSSLYGYTTMFHAEYITTSAVTKNIVLTALRITGGGTLSILRGDGAYMEVEDLGPSSKLTVIP